MINTEVLIIGSGVIGLAIARTLSSNGLDVILIEKEDRSGEGVSSRNSGVIHAGMYYPTNSLKANLCVAGNKMLYDYCDEKNIPHERLGKLIIAANKDEERLLSDIYNQGVSNSVDLKKLTKEEVIEMEPEVHCSSAIYSPNTGIIDVPEFINALEADLQRLGALISFKTNFLNSKRAGNYFISQLESEEIFQVQSEILINCAGLQSENVATNIQGLDKKDIAKVNFGRGHYYKYSGTRPFNKLIYPMPSSDGLGIHFSIDLAGQSKFGPDMEWVETIDYTFDESLKDKFFHSIRKYWPQIDSEKLQPDYSGIRPKIYQQNESQADFLISSPNDHNLEGFFNLQGIESPGLTSSLAIADYLDKTISGCRKLNSNI
tara:strand:+ start:1477 stop:2601 length:1125 start_codon:yes stop_codon:yes gene_type:complete